MSLFTLPTRSEVDTATVIQKIKEPPKVKSTVNLALAIKEAESKVRQTLGAEAEGFSLITSDNEFIAYCKKAKEDDIVALDTETTGLDSMLDSIVGVCMYSPSQKPMYAPINHISSITKEKLENQVSIEALKEGMKLLSECKIIFHNAYFDIMIVYQATGIMLEAYWDTQIAGHLLNENESHSLKDLYAKYILNNQVDATYFNELFDGIPFCYIPPHVAVAYAAKDSIMTYKVFRFQERFLTAGTEECKEYGLERMAKFHREELIPMIPVLVDMKLTGMEFDFEEAKRLKEKYTKLKEEAVVDFNKSLEPFKDAIIENGMPYPLNYNSSQQIKKLFYNIAQIGVVYRKEPTGTGKNVREAILALDKFKGKPIRTVVECLTKVKEYDKVISTFIVKLAEDAKLHGGKIHANLNMSSTVTGRLSSSQPNMQQVPAKMKDIRRMFTAGKDNYFVSCDFSKQEPCCLASVCKDPALIEVFHSGLDIYSKIASMIFNLPYEDCLEHNPDGTTNAEGKERRSVAKKVVLSILYSKGLKTLADDLHSDINKAQEVMDAVKAAYPVMAKWMDDTVKSACQVGYEDNLFGRRRRWPELLKPSYEFIFPKGTDESTITYQSAIFRGKLKRARFNEKFKVKQFIEAKGVRVIDNEAKQAEAKRQVANFQIQGGAAVITMRAMRKIYSNPRLKELGCKLVMSIHDEVLCTVPKQYMKEAVQLIEECMLSSGEGLAVPLACDTEVSDRWYGEPMEV